MRELRHKSKVTSPGWQRHTVRHTGALTPEPTFLIAMPHYFLGRMRELRARLEKPRRPELGGGAKRLTCCVMSHSLGQHGLPAARWAVHEDASGWVDADLKPRGGEKEEPGSPSPAGDPVDPASPSPARSGSLPACRARSV